jgi:processive 1,2-diacylglycerol beta-glucosyltransferase
VKIGCVYVNAGKGHYVPAKAICDALNDEGVEAEMLDYFQMIGAPWFDHINQSVWRWQLRFPDVERAINSKADHSEIIRKIVIHIRKETYRQRFAKWAEEHQFDAFISTHFLSSLMLPLLSEDKPVFAYASDVFFTPTIGLSEKLAKFYISSEEGVDYLAQHSFAKEKTVLAPFPLQSSCLKSPKLTKSEARSNLELKEMFTLLINLGGEGIGTIELIEKLEKKALNVQVVLVGGMKERDKKSFKVLEKRCKNVIVKVAGFVDNIYAYLYAADIVVGKAGINAILEAIYLKRPFLVTTVYYTVQPAADYLMKYNIGWFEQEVGNQVAIIERALKEKNFLESYDKAFEKVPIQFGSSFIAKDLIQELVNLKDSHK